MIRTPNHDSIMLWLDAEIPTLLPAIAPSGWNTEELRYWETKSAAPIPDWPGIEIRDKVWEQPLTNHRHFTEGYADLAVNAHVPCLSEKLGAPIQDLYRL